MIQFYNIISIMLSIVLIQSKRKLFTISSTMPTNTFQIGNLAAGQALVFVINIDNQMQLYISIKNVNDSVSNTSQYYVSNNTNSYSSSYTAVNAGLHYFNVRGGYGVSVYSLAITINNTQFYSSYGITSNTNQSLLYDVVESGCTSAKFVSMDYQKIQSLAIFEPNKLPISISSINNGTAYSLSSNFSIDIANAGQYGFLMKTNSTYNNNLSIYHIYDYINIDIICFDSVCGDERKDQGEQCDNGNMTGCVNCVIDYSYSCGSYVAGSPCLCYTSTYTYNLVTRQCQIDCHNIPYALEIVSGTNDECTCQQPYCFDTAFSICRLGCPPVQKQTKILFMALAITLPILGLVIFVILLIVCLRRKFRQNNNINNQIIGQSTQSKCGNHQWVVQDVQQE